MEYRDMGILFVGFVFCSLMIAALIGIVRENRQEDQENLRKLQRRKKKKKKHFHALDA